MHDLSDYRLGCVSHVVSLVMPAMRAERFKPASAKVWVDADGDVHLKLTRYTGSHYQVRGTPLKEREGFWVFSWAEAGVAISGQLPVFGRSNAEFAGEDDDSITIVCRKAAHNKPRQFGPRVPNSPVNGPPASQQLVVVPSEPAERRVAASKEMFASYGHQPSIKQLVTQINRLKDELGDDLVLEVLPSGHLRALAQYS